VLLSWDQLLLEEDTQGFEPTYFGITQTTAPAQCRDSACIYFTKGSYVQLPSHNFGHYSGLTFSFWIKPTIESGADARVIDFSAGADKDRIIITRKGASSDIEFSVGLLTGQKVATCVASSAWAADSWTHILWTMTSSSSANADDSTWTVYVNGAESVSISDGVFPADSELASNYIGKAFAAEAGFVGFIDSFLIAQDAAGADRVAVIFQVCERVL
jgi:hypothetical protein